MKRLAVVGQPIAHSRSPAMQSAALEALGLDGEWTYEAIEVAPEEFSERIRELMADGFAGLNVTIPHKERALTIATHPSERARAIGAANTLTFGGDGEIAAENTDAGGLLAAIGKLPAGASAVVLGAGGSARAAVWALRDAGANVTVWNRTPSRAAEVATALGATAVPEGGAPDIAGARVIVNATAVGLATSSADLSALPVDPADLHEDQTIADLPYTGEGETPLAAAARAAGATVIDGLELLVRQGAASLRIWTGQDPPLDPMRKAAQHQGRG